ncbi:calpain-9 [Chiloscyllium plagiosum]|uniref:calpain-9 n=1 Tax=Chiloscyllium plagiosum TaxID=36176 RepID=UPI001CB84964|nr:calpain-9 [Chiloscyllium plagiosum]
MPYVFSSASGGSQKKKAVKDRGTIGVKARKATYQELKNLCLTQGVLYEDPEFPADESSLFYSEKPAVSFEWKRPKEISSNPKFVIDGASRTDICQGDLGDCWFLAAVASLTLNQKIMCQVVPLDQSFDRNYAGIFHFRFWQYNEWVDVIIDDRLPTFRNRLVFLHSASNDEFWSALLEKAYAKLYGGYESLKGGSTLEAMEDFTGGMGETFNLKEAPPNLYSLLQKALKRGSMLGCSIDITSAAETEARTTTGLVKGHAYSVTGLEEVNSRGRRVQLIRVRNPWGQVEWNGPWSDNSPEWKTVDASDYRRLNNIAKDDGEFWMSFDDFKRHYDKVEVCNLTPDSLDEDSFHKWEVTVFEGTWIKGCTAGGCRNFQDTFWVNPQYKVKLLEADEEQDDGKDECTMMVALMQKNRRKLRKEGADLLTIGFAIYEAEGGIDHLQKEFFRFHASKAKSKTYINIRENSERFKLPPGDYVIVPTTFQPEEEADFLIRLFTEKKTKTLEMGDKVGADLPEPSKPTVNPQEESQEEKQFRSMFEQISGKDLVINAYELQDILNTIFAKRKEVAMESFDIETCRSIVSLYNKDNAEGLGFDEFKIFWSRMKLWTSAFLSCDHDKSGTISAHELRTAVKNTGFQVNNQLLQLMVIRYSDAYLQIDFDNYLRCMVRLETAFRSFKACDTRQTGEVTLNLMQWLYMTMNI